MENQPDIHDLLASHIAGRLTPDQTTAVERALRESPDLRAELQELQLIAAGLSIMDRVQGEHIDSEQLVMYAESPSRLKDPDRRVLEAHLAECNECREELELCRHSFRTVPDKSSGIVTQLTQWLIGPGLRPALAAAAAVVVMVGAMAVWQLSGPGASVARVELSVQLRRGEQQLQPIEINNAAALLNLELVLPGKDGAYYDVALLDSLGEAIVVYPHRLQALPLVVPVPGELLAAGNYTVRVTENVATDTAVPADTFAIPIVVKSSR